MSIKTKLNPKNLSSNEWIMNSPEALVILMTMGTGIGFLFFGLLSIVSGFNKSWIFMVLFGVFSFMSLKKFINISKMIRKFGFKDARGGFTCSGYIWHRDEYGNKIDGGIKNGNNGSEQTDEVCGKTDAGKNKRIREEVGHIYFKSK